MGVDRILCRLGRHTWVIRHNPEVGGKASVFHVCRRCGKDRPEYEPSRTGGTWLAGGGFGG